MMSYFVLRAPYSEQFYEGDGDERRTVFLKCWREMQNFLAEVVRDQSDDFPFASDVLRLMRSIERKFEVQV